MSPETENLFDRLDCLGKDYGWAARIILIGFKASGLYAHENGIRPIKAFVRESIYKSLKPDEKPKFFVVVASLLQNPDAISLLTTNTNHAHSAYKKVGPLSEADVVRDIKIIIDQLIAYERDNATLIALFHQPVQLRYISQLQATSSIEEPTPPDST